MCLIPFQCLWVGVELYLANKLIEKAISGRVQLARYINAPMTLRYGTSGPSKFSPFLQGRNESFFTQVNGQSLANLKDVLYPYKKTF